MPRKIGKPDYQRGLQRDGQTYKSHDASDGAFDVDTMVPKHSDQARLGSYRRDLDVCPVVAHDRFEFFDPLCEQPVEFSG